MAYNIDINGEIGGYEADKITVLNKLREANGKDVTLNISSLGGNVDDAFAIYDALKAYEGKTVAKLTGFVASAATIIAMGADEVQMSENALFLVHNCSSGIMLFGGYNAEQIDELITQLNDIKETNKKVDLIISNIYAKNTGKRAKTMLDLMAEERWLTYDEAKDYGFVTGKLAGQRTNMSAIAASIAAHKLPPLPESFTNQQTEKMEFTKIETMLVELKNLVAGVVGNQSKQAEVKIMDSVEVTAAISALEADINAAKAANEDKDGVIAGHIATIESNTATIEANAATIAEQQALITDLQNKLALAGVDVTNPKPAKEGKLTDDVKPTEEQEIFAQVMSGVTANEVALYGKKNK